jgi:hypothetical protein
MKCRVRIITGIRATKKKEEWLAFCRNNRLKIYRRPLFPYVKRQEKKPKKFRFGFESVDFRIIIRMKYLFRILDGDGFQKSLNILQIDAIRAKIGSVRHIAGFRGG